MNFLTRLIKHELITGTFLVFVGSMFGNIMAFLLNLFLARNLTYSDYGIYASLISIITLVTIPTASIGTVIVRFSSNYYTNKKSSELNAFYRKMFQYLMIFSLSVLGILTLFSPFINGFLHLNNLYYIYLTGISVFIFYIQSFNTSFIQGLMRFGYISIISAVGGFSKLIFGVLLVLLGFRVFGALWGWILMGVVVILLSLYPLKSIIIGKFDKSVKISSKEILEYALPAFISVLFMASFTSTDILLVKHFFSPDEAGLYGGLSLVGRVIFYFTLPIPSVMFPLLIKRHNLGKSFNKLFYLSLLLVFLPSVFITILYFIAPEFFIKIFLGGGAYFSLTYYIGYFGIFLTVYSLLNVCVSFFLSLNKKKIAPLIVLGSVLQIILIYLFHNNFYEIIVISTSISFILFVVLIIYFFHLYSGFKNPVID